MPGGNRFHVALHGDDGIVSLRDIEISCHPQGKDGGCGDEGARPATQKKHGALTILDTPPDFGHEISRGLRFGAGCPISLEQSIQLRVCVTWFVPVVIHTSIFRLSPSLSPWTRPLPRRVPSRPAGEP